jgi:hypothetical protein
MKIVASVIASKKKKEIILDRGDGVLNFDVKKDLPGYRVIGVSFYPTLDEICIYVVEEKL